LANSPPTLRHFVPSPEGIQLSVKLALLNASAIGRPHCPVQRNPFMAPAHMLC
jgi:hypothetical protein